MRTWAAIAVLLTGCLSERRVTEDLELHPRVDADGNDVPDSGVRLSAEQLTRGAVVFARACQNCHGEKGDGRGVSAIGMRPAPRNFVLGQFKFSGTGSGDLPSDAQLERTIRRGLDGTPMLAWDLQPTELTDVIAFLKTLSPRWKEEGVKSEVEVSVDPFVGREAEGVALGRRVFHVARGGAGCNGCHASFETHETLAPLIREATAQEPVFGEQMYGMTLKESSYPALEWLPAPRRECEVWLERPPDLQDFPVQLDGLPVARDEQHLDGWDVVEPEPPPSGVRAPRQPAPRLRFFGPPCERLKQGHPSLALWRNQKVLPPSFLFQKVKTAPAVGSLVATGAHQRVTYTAAMQREDLYRVIATGVGGAAMPGWKGVLEEEQLWALAYYVQSVMALRGTSEAVARRASFEAP